MCRTCTKVSGGHPAIGSWRWQDPIDSLEKNIDLGGKTLRMIWGWVKTLAPSEPKIAGKWMFISLKMVCIGIDP